MELYYTEFMEKLQGKSVISSQEPVLCHIVQRCRRDKPTDQHLRQFLNAILKGRDVRDLQPFTGIFHTYAVNLRLIFARLCQQILLDRQVMAPGCSH